MTDENSIDVIGIKLFNKPLKDAAAYVQKVIESGEVKSNLCITATGAHGMVCSKKNDSFRELLNSFHMNLPDGMPGVWVGRMKGAKDMERCYGPDFFADVMRNTAGTGIRHFLCGGAEGVAEQLKKECFRRFGNSSISGVFCPPFNGVEGYDYKSIADQINESGADIVWVGLGTPKQEQFMDRLSKHTDVHFLITVGAAFDFYIGNVKQAPSWMQKAGLEWFFRLCVEPKRLFGRYIEVVPKFIFYSILDLIKKPDK